jgi:hypothetical protein
MSRRSSDREAIEAEIDRILSLGLDQIRTLWRTTFRSSAYWLPLPSARLGVAPSCVFLP